MALFPKESLRPSGAISLTSASLMNWTKTSGFIKTSVQCIWSNYFPSFVSLHYSKGPIFLFFFFTPRDCKISREEMIEYFTKASSLQNCKMGFVHTFTETSSVKPSFCRHCSRLVSAHFIWGSVSLSSSSM